MSSRSTVNPPLTPKPVKKELIQNAINDLVALKLRFGGLGMYKTMHSLEEPTRVAGWEFGDLLKAKRG